MLEPTLCGAVYRRGNWGNAKAFCKLDGKQKKAYKNSLRMSHSFSIHLLFAINESTGYNYLTNQIPGH